MKTYLLIGLIVFLSSCGNQNGRKAGWTTENMEAFKDGCIQSLIAQIAGTPQSAADTYCTCMITKISTTWNYTDYSAHTTDYQSNLNQNGTIDRCAESAGIQ
jgi:hypothetical protein